MSIFRASDYSNKKEIPKKTKLPTEYKTKYSTCPQCIMKKYVKGKGCILCHFKPYKVESKPVEFKKAIEL